MVVKGVRFKVDFTRSTPKSSGGYNTLVSLTLEKGAQSSFKGSFPHLTSFASNETIAYTPLPLYSRLRSAQTGV